MNFRFLIFLFITNSLNAQKNNVPNILLINMNLVLFKITDLRFRDHEALTKAFNKSSEVLLVFCLDPIFYQEMNLVISKWES